MTIFLTPPPTHHPTKDQNSYPLENSRFNKTPSLYHLKSIYSSTASTALPLRLLCILLYLPKQHHFEDENSHLTHKNLNPKPQQKKTPNQKLQPLFLLPHPKTELSSKNETRARKGCEEGGRWKVEGGRIFQICDRGFPHLSLTRCCLLPPPSLAVTDARSTTLCRWCFGHRSSLTLHPSASSRCSSVSPRFLSPSHKKGFGIRRGFGDFLGFESLRWEGAECWDLLKVMDDEDEDGEGDDESGD